MTYSGIYIVYGSIARRFGRDSLDVICYIYFNLIKKIYICVCVRMTMLFFSLPFLLLRDVNFWIAIIRNSKSIEKTYALLRIRKYDKEDLSIFEIVEDAGKSRG